LGQSFSFVLVRCEEALRAMTVADYATSCSKESSTFQHAKKKRESRRKNEVEFPEIHTVIAVTTFLSYYILIIIGHVKDFLRKLNLVKHGKSSVKDVSVWVVWAYRVILSADSMWSCMWLQVINCNPLWSHYGMCWYRSIIHLSKSLPPCSGIWLHSKCNFPSCFRQNCRSNLHYPLL